MLNLDRQNQYRARYQSETKDWQPSGDAYEATIRRYLSKDSVFLDLGCGRGGLPEKLSQEQFSALYGLDPDIASLTEYRAPDVRLANGLADDLPYKGNSFDVVIATWLFEHLPTPEQTLTELHRVLCPSGKLILLTPNVKHPLLWANRISQLLPAIQGKLVERLYDRAEADTFPVTYKANTPAALRNLAFKANLQVKELQIIPDPSYLAFNDVMYQLSVGMEKLLPRSWGVHLLVVMEK